MTRPENSFSTLLLGLAIMASSVSCVDDYCTVIQNDTKVFLQVEHDPTRAERLPLGSPFATLHRGERVRVLWMSDLKDQLVYKVELRDGREGYIFHRSNLGMFALAVRCSELNDPETLREHLPN